LSNGKFEHPALVVAYHPQCPHCKTIVEDIVQLATDVAANKVGATIDAINMSTLDAKQSAAIKVQSYPTIRLYTAPGEFKDYKGERTEAGYMALLANNGVKIAATF
jgi:thiol-disulfide isomerase/thioredoxin